VTVPYADRMDRGHRPLNDEGNALRFVDMFGAQLRRVAVSGEWAILQPSGLWELVKTDEQVIGFARSAVFAIREEAANEQDPILQDALLTWATRSSTGGRIKTMVDLARGDVRIQAHADDFDANPNIIVVKREPVNTVVELLPTGLNARSLEPSDMVTMITNCRWNPDIINEPPTAVKEYIETFIPEEERLRMLFKLLGYSLMGGNSRRILMFLWGRTTTGKSQLAEAIRNALGDYCRDAPASIFRGHFDDKPRPDIINVLPRRIVFLNEAAKTWQLHGDRIKDMTGGANIPVRGMRSNEFIERTPDFTPVIVTNAMPKIAGVDSATQRRIVAVEFAHQLQNVTEDETIKDRFVNDPEVHEWLLMRLLKGWKDQATTGLQDAIDYFGLDTEKAFSGLSHVYDFLDWLRDESALLEIDGRNSEEDIPYGEKSSYVRTRELHAMYKWWITNMGSRQDKNEALSERDLNGELKDMHGWTTTMSAGTRWIGKQLLKTVGDMQNDAVGISSEAAAGLVRGLGS
jgi:P4 family phage/plasmid primase-like protien